MLSAFGLPHMTAKGEAEAECCALERDDLVDAVVTTDGDALVFGAKVILRLEKKGAGKFRRALVYRAKGACGGSKTSDQPTRGFCLLLALVSGGDYSKGVERSGPKLTHNLYNVGVEDLTPFWILMNM
jgi:Holliday junction resolvase YEN1